MITYVSVFRAITGEGRYADGEYKHAGVSDDTARKHGSFVSNYSSDQSIGLQTALNEGNPMQMRRVKGLPVFLNREEAEDYLGKAPTDRTYLNKPLLAEIQIPWEWLFGNNPRLKLVRNMEREKDDQVLTAADIEGHLMAPAFDSTDLRRETQGRITGECFLGVEGKDTIPDELVTQLREHEILYRPVSLIEGRIDLSKGFEMARINQEPYEGKPYGYTK